MRAAEQDGWAVLGPPSPDGLPVPMGPAAAVESPGPLSPAIGDLGETVPTRDFLIGGPAEGGLGTATTLAWPSGWAAPPPGTQLGPFLLIRPRAVGGQAMIWEAVRTGSPVRLVALKVFRPEYRLEDLRGILVLRLGPSPRGGPLDPAILPLYEFGEAEGHVYAAAPLVDGFTLAEILDQRRARLARRPPLLAHRLALLPERAYLEAVARAMAHVARALGWVHAARFAHRDVKPANILMDRHHEHRVYLMDFGSARDLDEPIGRGPTRWTGTPVYMACEALARGGRPDEIRCDIFSLGVSLYEAATLRRPYQIPLDLPRSRWGRHVAAQKIPRPRAIRPQIPGCLEAVILRAMDRDPARRYPGAGPLLADLLGCLAAPDAPPAVGPAPGASCW